MERYLHPQEGLVAATVEKPLPNTKVGFGISRIRNNWRFVISTLAPDGMFASTELQEGQTILSINGIPISDFSTTKEAADVVRTSDIISIVATRSVLVSVPRDTISDSSVESSLGIQLGESKYGDLIILQIEERSIVGRTNRFHSGMKLLAINDNQIFKHQMSLSTAQSLLQSISGSLLLLAVPDNTSHSIPSKPVRSVSLDAPAPASTNSPAIKPTLSLFLGEGSVTVNATLPRQERKRHTHYATPPPRIGLDFLQRKGDWRVVISFVASNGLFSNTELQAGQTLLSINRVPANSITSTHQVRDILRQWSTGKLGPSNNMEIVATKSVLATVHKSTSDTKVGIGLCFDKKNQTLRIHRITRDGLFAINGLLRAGMVVIAINDLPCPSNISEANRVVKESLGDLSILAVPASDSADFVEGNYHIVDDDDYDESSLEDASQPTDGLAEF